MSIGAEERWSELLSQLVERGLSGVGLVIADEHRGLADAVRRHLPEAGRQRCTVHFETERGNAISTGNARLAVLRSFFFYVATQEAAAATLAQRALATPFETGRTMSRNHGWPERRLCADRRRRR